jgi:hypothetical protein
MLQLRSNTIAISKSGNVFVTEFPQQLAQKISDLLASRS